MNRYDLLRLIQELGQLIEGATEKTGEEVARELIACGRRRLTEAQAVEVPSRPANGTALPLPAADAASDIAAKNVAASAAPAPAPADVSRA